METNERVVVTGIGIICSLGRNKSEVLPKMLNNESGIGTIQSFDTAKFISHIGAEVKDYQASEHFTEEELECYDRCSQYGMIAVKEALDEAGITQEFTSTHRIGLAFGTCNGGIRSLEEQKSIVSLDPRATSRYPFYQQADQIASRLGFTGPVTTINTACAASGNAIGFAFDMIQNGYSDLMLAGGADSISLAVYAGFNALRALNSDPCSPYSDKYGLSLGEGAAFVVMEPLSRALKRGAKIYAEVCGYGLSNDAYHETAPEPEGRGIAAAVKYALRNSEIQADQIDYINTHGTGTRANDAAELSGLRQVFGADLLPKIRISSTKSSFGHNLGAAAAIEYVTALLMMEHGYLPATLRFEAFREGCGDVNLITNEAVKAHADYFLCNNSAFGGQNVSLLSKKWIQDATRTAPIRTSKRVAVVGLGWVGTHGYGSGNLHEALVEGKWKAGTSDFHLKEFDKSLYDRRMNRLTQYSIGAASLAMKDAGIPLIPDVADSGIGMVYGTSKGSFENASKYLWSMLENGPEFASSIYFPGMVLNSTAGKVAMKLDIQGYGSSLSTGGTDGQMALLYGFEMVRNGLQQTVLAGSGDEISDLGLEIDGAMGLAASAFPGTEGGCFLVLTDLQDALDKHLPVYSEVKSFGVASGCGADGKSAYETAIEMALHRAHLDYEDIWFVYYHSTGIPGTLVKETELFQRLFESRSIPVQCLNDKTGFAESTGSLLHIHMAAEKLFLHKNNHNLDGPAGCMHALVISSSIHGNVIATVLSGG